MECLGKTNCCFEDVTQMQTDFTDDIVDDTVPMIPVDRVSSVSSRETFIRFPSNRNTVIIGVRSTGEETLGESDTEDAVICNGCDGMDVTVRMSARLEKTLQGQEIYYRTSSCPTKKGSSLKVTTTSASFKVTQSRDWEQQDTEEIVPIIQRWNKYEDLCLQEYTGVQEFGEEGVSMDTRDGIVTVEDQIKTLLHDAACHQDIVLQASQALNIAELFSMDKNSSPAVIEGERLLLLASERRALCLEEVNLLKENVLNPYLLKESNFPPPCAATLTLSDIKLPLHHEFLNSLNIGKSRLEADHFVLIAYASYKNIHSTSVVSCSQGTLGTSPWALGMSNIVMKNVPHDFTLTIKVFGVNAWKNNNEVKKVKEKEIDRNIKIRRSTRSKKKREEEHKSRASPKTVFRKSNFKLLGENKLTLVGLIGSIGNVLTNYELQDVPSTCPIEGRVQMRVNYSPEYTATASGFLTFMEDVGGYPAWNSRWCTMKGNEIFYWRQPEDERVKEAIGSIDLRHCEDEFVKLLPPDICVRRHTFELKLSRQRVPSDINTLNSRICGDVTELKHWICCEDEENRISWMTSINKQLSDAVAWR